MKMEKNPWTSCTLGDTKSLYLRIYKVIFIRIQTSIYHISLHIISNHDISSESLKTLK